MKNFSAIFLLALILCPQFVHADPDNPTGVNQPGKATKTYNKLKFNAPPEEGNLSQIQGNCSIVPSPSNPIAGPCVNVVLVLNHADGSEYLKNRTSPLGKFAFESEAGQKYQLMLGSKLFEIVSPTGLLQAGQKIELRLRQK